MYARHLGGQDLTFDFGEGLIDDNLLLVDRETGSVWSQLAGKAVNGAMEGTPLEALPTLQTTWKFWRDNHPDTRVMIIDGERGRPYLYRDFVPGVRGTRRARPTAHDISTVGLGLVVGGEAWFYPFSELDRAKTPQTLEVGGQTVRIHYRKEALTAWAEDADGKLLTTVIAYQRGWMSFFPDSEVFRAGR